jgi:dipeptidyl aminopeptidase/acylaminoacyl peptidase
VRERIAWSSDGRLAYSNSDGSTLEAMDVDSRGPRVETLLARTMEPPHSWSTDGSRIAFERRGDIWIAELGGSEAPLAETPLRETDAAFSPDGRLIAYTANVLGGVGDVVVQDLDTAERWTISARPGKLPLWRQDGTELFWAEDRPARLMAADVRATPSVSFGEPRAVLTEDELGDIFVMSVAGISPDGERFLVLNQGDALAESLSRGLIITLNWTAELNELAATN